MKKGRDILLLLMLCTVIVYFNHFDNSFHFDDSHTIVNNLSIRNLHNIPSFFTDGSTFSSLPPNQSYRPVVTTLNAIDYALSDEKNLKPFWFHVSIFASFIFSGLLLYLFLLHLLGKTRYGNYKTEISLLVTGWFWLHPANAETINYIIARSDSFSTCMVLLAFVLYCCWPLAKRSFLYLVPFIIGFLSKETAIIFLPLLFLYEFLIGNEDDEKPMLRLILGIVKKLIIPIIVSGALLLLYKEMQPATWEAGGEYNKQGYWLTQPYGILHYVGNFFYPRHLVADTDWEWVHSPSDYRFIVGVSFVLLLITASIYFSFKKRFRLIGFGLWWFLLALLPTSLVPLAEVINDHRTFFPYIGLFISAAGLLQYLQERTGVWLEKKTLRVILPAVVLTFLVSMALMTWQRNKVWHSEYSLWKEVTEKAPANGRGWMHYGISQMAAGDFKGADSSFNLANQLLPGYSFIYINYGVLKNAMGEFAEAEDYFRTAISFGATNPEAYARYAEFLINQNRSREARTIINKGLLLSPHHEMLITLDKKIGEK